MNALHREWVNTQSERVTLDAPELRHVSDPAPARCVQTSTGIVIGGAVSRMNRAPYAGTGPHRRPPLVRRFARRALKAAVSALGSVNVLMWLVGLAAAAMLLTGCTGPSDLEAERATAAALQDAIAQAQRERPDLWTPETIERAQAAALIAAAHRK